MMRSEPSPHSNERTSREMDAVVGSSRHLVAFLDEGAISHPLGEGVGAVVVGRGAECNVQIDRATLSRRHFVLRGASGSSIEDLGSANGTRVNGRPLTPRVPTPLEPDALVEAGGVFFAVRDRRGRPARAAGSDAPPPLPDGLTARGVVVGDPAMANLHRLVRDTAASSLPVLILGETGVGKEILAAAVVACSPRAAMPFLRINCAAFPETLLESELFGYEPGAFTGASRAKPGLIEAADGGTLLFDEIGEMPMTTQAKLLRVLESSEVQRVGALRGRPLDVRFIAATHRDLPQRIREGTFRRDLYYRLNGVTLAVPPLRRRRAEIAPLARAFADRAAASMRRAPVEVSADAIGQLERHPWPGNVRELRHVVERAVALCEGDTLTAEHVRLDPPPLEATRDQRATHPDFEREPAPPEGSREGLLRVDADAERDAILDALRRAGGNQTRAAVLLGISRRTLLRRLDEYSVSRPRKSEPPGAAPQAD